MQYKPAFKEDLYKERRCQKLNVKIWNIIWTQIFSLSHFGINAGILKKYFGRLYSKGLILVDTRITSHFAFLCFFFSLSFLQWTQTGFFCSFRMTSDESAEPTTRCILGLSLAAEWRNVTFGAYGINNLYIARRKVSQKKRAASCPL